MVSKRPSSASLSAAAREPANRSVALGVAVFTAVVLFAILFPWFPGGQAYESGATADRAIVAQREVSYESAILTEQVRQEAVEAVGDVFVLDTEVRERQVDELQTVISTIEALRADQTLSSSARESEIMDIPGTDLSQRSAAALGELDEDDWDQLVNEVLNSLTRALTSAIGDEDVQGARSRAAGYLSSELSADEVLAATELMDPLIEPTLIVDVERTETLRQEAEANTPPVRVTYEPGDEVVAQGEVIDEVAMEAIEELAIQPATMDPRLLLASAMAAMLSGAALGGHIWVVRPRALRGMRRLVLLVLLFVVPVALAKFALPVLLPDDDRFFLAQALPLAAGPIVAAVLLDVPSGVLLSVLIAALSGFTAIYLPAADPASPVMQLDAVRLMFTTLAGSLAGVYVAARADRLQHYLAAGFAVAAAAVVAMSLILLLDPAWAWRDVPWVAGAALGGGLLTAMVAVGAFILLSRPFGIITRVELMELAQLNHPLLRRLQDEAPGTFQHSMLVGNLAERAADRIGADSLLVRVGAYYHDIGKTVAPSFFVENFGESENPHEHLDPLQSTRVIHQHVTAGVELARKEGLPEAVIEFIPQHHGCRIVAYFYRQAASQSPDVDVELFRYPGPKPQSRETALVMIADACEAAVRASTDRSQERIRWIVEETIRERIEEGEFDECDISMRDLRVVAELYTSTLAAVFHPRVEYPEPTRQELAARGGRSRGAATREEPPRSRRDDAAASPAAAGERPADEPSATSASETWVDEEAGAGEHYGEVESAEPPPPAAEPPREEDRTPAPPPRRIERAPEDSDDSVQPPERPPRSRRARSPEEIERHEYSEDDT